MPTRSVSTRVNDRDLATLITWLEANGKRPRTISRAIFIAVRMIVQHAVSNGAKYCTQAEADTILSLYSIDDTIQPLQLGGLHTTDEGEARALKLMEE